MRLGSQRNYKPVVPLLWPPNAVPTVKLSRHNAKHALSRVRVQLTTLVHWLSFTQKGTLDCKQAQHLSARQKQGQVLQDSSLQLATCVALRKRVPHS